MPNKVGSRLPGRVWFIANLEMIQSKLAAGYSVLDIYREHEVEMNVRYPQFTRYVHKFIRKENKHQKQTRYGHQILNTSDNHNPELTPKRNGSMSNVHLTLQGKGGVGKSLVSSLIAQYLISQKMPVTVIDTDPVNRTLVGYKALNAETLELLEEGTLNERNFDKLIEQIIGSSKDMTFVVDNGASSFIPLASYLMENEAINMITDAGKQVTVHTVITGGQALWDTIYGFSTLVQQLPEKVDVVVWLNEFFGEIEVDGKSFEQIQIYEDHRKRVRSLITIERQTSATFGEDVKRMLDRKLTFDEIFKSEDFGLMAKSRLANVRHAIFSQLEAAAL